MGHLTPPFLIAILIAFTVHEFSHGLVASWLGDPTAREEGRLTLNPVAHLDPLGALLFLTIGFGWGKPVPINPRYFRNEKLGITLTALAGPLSNLLLAFITLFIGKLLLLFPLEVSTGVAQFFFELFQNLLFLNLGLMAFNLLPVAPLDGSKILAVFIPWRYERTYEGYLRHGPVILLALLLGERLLGIPLIVGWISAILNPILAVMERLL